MSILKTHNLQSPDSSSVNIALASDGKVGVGTNNPTTYKLHVQESTSAIARFERTGGAFAKVDIKAGTTAGNSYLTFSDSAASEVGEINYEHADDSLRIAVNSAERLRITSDGKMGLGTSSVDELLHIANTGGGASILIETNASSGGNVLFGDDSSNTVGRVQYLHSDNSMRFHTNGSERMHIDSNGLIGLGVTPTSHNTTTAFHIHDDYNSQGYPRIRLTNQSSGTTAADGYEITLDGSNLHAVHRQREDADIYFMTNNSERFRIGSAGQLGIAGTNYGDAGQVLKSGGSGAAPTWGAGGNFTSYAIVAEVRSGTSDAGTLTANTWMTRAINTEIADPDGIVSISSNQFTLQAGTYLIEWQAPAWRCDRHTTRLYDVTNSAARGNATLEFSQDSGSYTLTSSRGFARVTISGATVYKLETKGNVTKSGDGLGIDPNNLASCIYAMAKIYKEV